jgi:RimJ/RimL family protein N-acetyltransferase
MEQSSSPAKRSISMAAITSPTEPRPVIDPITYLAKETLKDGTEVTIRAIRPEDSASVLEGFKNLDRDAIYRRFFSPKRELSDAEIKQLTDVDFSRVVALVVSTNTSKGETLIGGGRYAVEGSESSQAAELAFLTDEGYRGRGIASLVLRHLIQLAQDAGVSRLEADVLADNHPMLMVFRRSGLPMKQRREGSVIHVILELRPDRS